MNAPESKTSPSSHPSASPTATTAVSSAAAQAGAKLRRAAILAVLLIIIGATVGLLPRWRQRDLLRAETREQAVLTVAVISPAPADVMVGTALPAEIKPLVEAPIYARASGYLKRWLVDIGAQVEAGQLLAEIDTPDLNQELARTRAELAQTEASLALAKTTAARWADLLKTASVSEQETAEKQADLALKAATVQAANANLHRLEELQSFARVTAPFAGTITIRQTDVGQLVAASGGKELFRLTQTRTLRVYVRIPQALARGVLAGQMAEITVPEIPGRVFPAKTVRTSGAMDIQSRTLLVELELDNARGEILAGTYAQARFPEPKLDAILTLPSTVVIFRAEGTQVAVVSATGKVELRQVSLGRDFGPRVEILSGVSATDRIVANPSDSLVAGTAVRVLQDTKPPEAIRTGLGK